MFRPVGKTNSHYILSQRSIFPFFAAHKTRLREIYLVDYLLLVDDQRNGNLNDDEVKMDKKEFL